jgi:hypothetical protein
MYKTFTTRFGTDAISKIKELRSNFPGCSFAVGMWKGSKGIFCFSSDTREYGEHWTLGNTDEFWSPNKDNIEFIRKNLSNYHTEWQDRITIKLTCGKELQIFPASALPKKVMFTRKQPQATDVPFDQTIDYGRLAYKMYDRSQSNEQIKLDDPMMLELVSMALHYSYTFPEALWDALDLISFNDIDKIFAAAMGMDWEFLQNEVKKSTVASQQMTGATAT